jgi:outer membrane protein assembly factor BamB
MSRCRLFLVPLALVGFLAVARSAVASGGLIPETTASRHGLTVAWFNQVQFDQGRSRVAQVVLHEGLLLIATDRAMLHAMDAETGQTLWVQQIGRPELPTLAPSANKELVAVVNGSQLYVLVRKTGKLLWKTQLSSAPGAGPAVSARRAYVPMLTGLVQSFRLKPTDDSPQEPASAEAKSKADGKGEDKADAKKLSAKELGAIEAQRRDAGKIDVPLACQSWGQALAAPVVIRQDDDEDRVAWSTDRGVLFVGGISSDTATQFLVRFNIGVAGGIVGKPSYVPPHPKVAGDMAAIFVTSRDGFVYACREKDGSSMWRFPVGEAMIEPAVGIDTCVYAAIQAGGLYCLDAQKGTQLWRAPQAAKVLALSKSRLYTADKVGMIHILDARNGARLDTLYTQNLSLMLTNTATDRLYLASDDGLIQCLREIDQVRPLPHNIPAAKAAKPTTEQKPMAKKAAEKKEAGEAKPARKPRAKKDEAEEQ